MMDQEQGSRKCGKTWKSDQPAGGDDANIYRQHRCGWNAGHTGACACRYCGVPRWSR